MKIRKAAAVKRIGDGRRMQVSLSPQTVCASVTSHIGTGGSAP